MEKRLDAFILYFRIGEGRRMPMVSERLLEREPAVAL